MHDIKKHVRTFVIAVLFTIIWFSFVITPMDGDIKVFMACARQASYIDNNLITSSFKVWELKSVFSRLTACIIYRIAILFAQYGTYLFEIVCKLIYSVIVILLSLVSMMIIFGTKNKKFIIYSIIVSSLLMSMHTGCHMQVEMTCSLIILLAFSLYINAIQHHTYILLKLFIAGALIGSTFFFKSILILLSVSVVSAVCIYKIENGIDCSLNELLIVMSGSIAAITITSIAILYFNPTEFRDMIDASAFQSTLISAKYPIKDILFNFVYRHLSQIRFVPIVIIGVACLLTNVIQSFAKKHYPIVFFHVTLWMMPAIFVILSYKFFIYHFVAYFFPSIVELYYFIHHSTYHKVIRMGSIAMTSFIIIWYFTQFSFFSSDVKRYIELDKLSYEKTENFLESIDYDRSLQTLYLDEGTGSYYLGNPSYLKYYHPLPLQRLPEDSLLACHVETVDKTMQFKGNYVSLYQDWFFNTPNRYKEIQNKLNSEYTHVGSYYVFTPPQSLHTSDAILRECELYQRK